MSISVNTALPAFTITFKDKFLNLVNYIGTIQYKKADNSIAGNITAIPTGLGRLATQPIIMNVAGDYQVSASGIIVGNIDGNTIFTINNITLPPPVSYYWSGNQKFNLIEDKSTLVFAFRTGVTPNMALPVAARINAFTAPAPSPSIKERFSNGTAYVFELNQDVTTNIESALSQLGVNVNDLDYYAFGHRTTNGGRFIPTNQILLELKPGYDIASVQNIVGTSATLNRTQFETIILDAKSSGRSSLNAASQLYESGIVKWCHPDFMTSVTTNSGLTP